MGVAGHLNDNADVTAPIYSYWPNDYGLYNMSGNVSEWVLDVYRPLTSEDVSDFRPFRGNVFKTKVLTPTGSIDEKYDATIYDIYGIEQYLIDFRAERQGKANIESKHSGAGRMYGYSQKNRLDALEDSLLSAIENTVKDAKKLLEKKQIVEASLKVQEIFDNVFDDYEMMVQQDPELAGYTLQISPIIRSGMADFILNTPGNLKVREVRAEENINRRNYRIADNIDYLDGDLKSSLFYPGENDPKDFNSGKKNEDWAMYQSGLETAYAGTAQAPTSLITDKSRIYKGGSWQDRAYYLNPGARRFLDENMSNATIGFRCAMDRVGSPVGLGAYE